MSFLDLATLTMHRRSEMESRINVFMEKVDQMEANVKKLKMQARGLVNCLNCEPSELKERFLDGMKKLDEYIYLATDFNLSFGKLAEANSLEYTPVHDFPNQLTPLQSTNLLDILSEPVPSTSKAQTTQAPKTRPKTLRPPKEGTLIEFSSASCSQESVPEDRIKEKEVQSEPPVQQLEELTLTEEHTKWDLPGQAVLHTDTVYRGFIMHIDGPALWIITEDFDEARTLMETMRDFYRQPRPLLSRAQLETLSYCAYYDDDSDCPYRCLFLRMLDDAWDSAELFLVDTGEVRIARRDTMQPLDKRFYEKPPFARCCYLAGIELTGLETSGGMAQLETFLKNYIGEPCDVEVDDNTSESLGVFIRLSSKQYLHDILVNQGLAVYADRHQPNSTTEMANVTTTNRKSEVTYNTPQITHNSAEGSYSPSDMPHGPPEMRYSSPEVRYSTPEVAYKTPQVAYVTPEGAYVTPEVAYKTPEDAYKTPEASAQSESDIGIVAGPEYEDALEAVTGYHNNDERDICKHYKGGPEKTCFKGARCKKRHVLLHPDGWTLDRVPVSVARDASLPAAGSCRRVKVSCVCHFDYVYVQLNVQDKLPAEPKRNFGQILPPTSLAALVRDMNSHATRAAHRPLKLAPAPGELVAAMFPIDQLWYRAQVLAFSTVEQSVQVRFIDYGNEMWIKENLIRELDLAYSLLPVQAVRCRLAGVGSRGDDPELWMLAKNELTNLVLDKTLKALIIAREYDELDIELYDDEDEPISARLAAKGLVELKEYVIQDDTNVEQRIVVP